MATTLDRMTPTVRPDERTDWTDRSMVWERDAEGYAIVWPRDLSGDNGDIPEQYR